MSLGAIGVLTQVMLYCEGCAVHCGMFSSLSDLCSLDPNSPPFPVVTTQASPDICPVSPGKGVQNHERLRTTALNEKKEKKKLQLDN